MTAAVTPGREELLALAEKLAAARKRHRNSAPRDIRVAHQAIADILFENMDAINAALRLAAKPADEGVRAATIEKCAKIAEPWPGFWLDEKSTDADRAVVAVRTEIAEKIRALSTTGEPKP